MARIKEKHRIGKTVYLRMDRDQQEHMVTGIEVRSTGLRYIISNGQGELYADEIEITSNKDTLKAIT